MKVHITRPLPETAVDFLREQGYQLTVPESEGLPGRESLLQSVGDVDALLSILTERIDAEVIRAAPRLKVISNMAVGFDNIDLARATERGIAVCNTPGVLTETSADFAWALLLATARRVAEADRYVREGRFAWWGPRLLLGTDVYGSTLGIVGLGGIGQAVARRAQGFGMEVIYHSPSAPERCELGAKVEFEELLERADFVTLHVPYKPETHHLISGPELEKMKSTAFLINTSRGPVVDEAALVRALQQNQIAGAGLDVFEREPEVDPGLLPLPNVVLAPHIASASLTTRGKMALLAARNLDDCLRGRRPNHLVNPEVWDPVRFHKG